MNWKFYLFLQTLLLMETTAMFLFSFVFWIAGNLANQANENLVPLRLFLLGLLGMFGMFVNFIHSGYKYH